MLNPYPNSNPEVVEPDLMQIIKMQILKSISSFTSFDYKEVKS